MKKKRTLPVGMHKDVGLFGERVRYKSPVTGRLGSIPKRLHGHLPELASHLSGESMRLLVDMLGADAYPGGQVHPDLVHTTVQIAADRRPLPKPDEHVYFLLKDRAVVYVGRAEQLEARIQQHMASGRNFDSYYAFRPTLPADIVETYYILKFEPPLNVARTGLKSKTRAALAKNRKPSTKRGTTGQKNSPP